jgi:hypothetical protein
MPANFARRVRAFLAQADGAATSHGKGRAFESLLCFLVEAIPGVRVHARNVLNPAGSEEVDVVFWNEQAAEGLVGFEFVVLAECKNWGAPVDSQAVVVFTEKLRARSCRLGILFAANGITGDEADLSRAHEKVSAALRDGYKILVVTRREVTLIRGPDDLVVLLKEKFCQLVASGTSLRGSAQQSNGDAEPAGARRGTGSGESRGTQQRVRSRRAAAVTSRRRRTGR